jgi:hypothetical protein
MLLMGMFAIASIPGQKAGAKVIPFSISTTPGMVPAFNSKITDYAVRCTTKSTTHLLTQGKGPITVGGKTYGSPLSLYVPLVANQGVQVNYGSSEYFIRCLPSNFPQYRATVAGHPAASGYLLTLANYSVVFDTSGVPVWWDTGVASPAATEPNYAEFLSPSTIAWSQANGSFQLVGLNGAVKGTVGGGNVPLDSHDLKLLPNGNYLGIERVTRDCPAIPSQRVNLSSWGLSSKASIIDDDIVEVTPTGHVVWRWSTANHVNVATADTQFHSNFPDVIHMNSVQYDGQGGVVFSARNLDAVYRVDMATGAITWKLAGSTTPQSLTFAKTPYPTDFSGQHDANVQPDGSITVHDDGTAAVPARLPRALHIRINLKSHVATIVKQVVDPRAKPSLCCGSANLLPSGDWVVSWGYNDYMTELSRSGVPKITITYPGLYSYRAELAEASVAAMRAGMSALHPSLHL